MKKIYYKIIVVSLIIGLITITVTAASVAGEIKSAVFSGSKIYVKDKNIPLSESLAVILKEGSSEAKTYAPVRDLFEKLGYIVEWNTADSSINLYPKPFTGYFNYDEFSSQAMPLIGAVHSEDVYLYSINSGNGAVLTYKNLSKAFDWICYSPRLIMPLLYVYDYDGDGEKEIVVSLNYGSGTGVDVDDLHIVKADNDNLIDYQFKREDCETKLKNSITHTVYIDGGRVFINIKSENSSNEVDLSAIYPDVSNAEDFNVFINTDILKFLIDANGTITMNAALCMNTKTYLNPQLIATVTANVSFLEGSFELSNIKIG